MTLQVHDFYTKEKLSTNRYHNVTMNNADFYILVSDDGKYRELSLQVTKKFHYERTVGYGYFKINKANEFNVLVDFIKSNKALILSKWHLNNEDYLDLMEGLELALIRQHSTCSFARKCILEAKVLFKFLVQKLYRRLKQC